MCASKKLHIQATAPLLPVFLLSPLEIIGVDFLFLEKSCGRSEYTVLQTILLITCRKIPPEIKPQTQLLTICATTLFLHWRSHLRHYIIKDESLRTGYLENLLFVRINNLRTISYHPHTNFLTERMNQTVLAMLRTLTQKY